MTKYKPSGVIGLGGTGVSIAKASYSVVVFDVGEKIEFSLPAGRKFRFKALPEGMEKWAIPSNMKPSDFVDLSDNVIVLRVGDDLILQYADGTEIAVKDFFANDNGAVTEIELGADDGQEISISSDAQGEALSNGAELIAFRGDKPTLLSMVGEGSVLQAVLGDILTNEATAQGDLYVWGDYGDGFGGNQSTYAYAAVGAGIAVAAGGGGGSDVFLYKVALLLGPQTDDGKGTKVFAYRNDGKLLGELKYNALTGKYEYSDSSGYAGVVVFAAIDSDDGADYLDEATGMPTNLGKGTVLLSVSSRADLGVGGAFQINELTTVVARELGISVNVNTGKDGISDVTVSADAKDASKVRAVNKSFGQAFGLGNDFDVATSEVVTTVDKDGKSNSDANDYGALLHALSQVRKDTGRSVEDLIEDIVKDTVVGDEAKLGDEFISDFMTALDDVPDSDKFLEKVEDALGDSYIKETPQGIALTSAGQTIDGVRYTNAPSFGDPTSATPAGAVLQFRYKKDDDTSKTTAWADWDKSKQLGLALDGSADGVYIVEFRYKSDAAVSKSEDVKFTLDTVLPTVSADKISVSGGSGVDGAFKEGDVITITWDNGSSGDNNADIWDVTLDLTSIGLGAAVKMEFDATTKMWKYVSDPMLAGVYYKGGVDIISVTDRAGNSVKLDDPINIVIDTSPPTLSATPTTGVTNGGDEENDTIILTVTFDEDINGLTDGSDNTIFTLDGTGVEAVWSGTDGTNTRILTYTIQSGQMGQAAIDEAALKAVLLAGITDDAGNALSIPDDIADIDTGADMLPYVDAKIGAVESIAISSNAGSDNSYSSGDIIKVQVVFSKDVVVDTTSGTPQLELQIGTNARQASYFSGSGTNTLVFAYEVQTADEDTDGISISENKLDFNGGTIKDWRDKDATLDHDELTTDANHKVDGDALGVVSVVISDALITRSDAGTDIKVAFTFSAAMKASVAPTIVVAQDTVLTNPTGGVWSSENKVYTLTYTISNAAFVADEVTFNISGAQDASDNVMGGVVGRAAVDASGNIAKIDAAPPVLSASTSPVAETTNDGDSVGDTIFLTITFSENVNGLTDGNDSTIFKLDGTGVEAVWSGTDGTNTRILTYTIKAGDSGQATIDEAALKTALVAGITDGAGNAFEHSGDIADIDAGEKALPVVDTTAPTLSADAPPTFVVNKDGEFAILGDTIALTITFSENVNGLTGGNDSTIFKIGDAGVEAVWSGTDGTNTRILTYTVKAGDSGQATIDEATLKAALLAAGIADGVGNALSIPDDIGDIDAGANALPVVDDGMMPTLSASTPPIVHMMSGGDSVGDTITLTVTFSENVNGLTGGNDSTIFKLDGTGVEAVWSGTDGTNTRILTYTVKAGDNGQATIDEAALKTALLAADITDGAGNALVISGDVGDIKKASYSPQDLREGNPFDGFEEGDYSTPTFADIDGDGDLDLVIGEVFGNINYYKNTGDNKNPTYEKQTGDDNPFNGFDVGNYSAPTFADIDGDGDFDLVIGELGGNLNYYKNTGDNKNPTYTKQTGGNNPFNGFDVGNYSAPTFADIDGDGDFDLVIGELAGNLNYYKNTGDNTDPTYEKKTGDDNPFNGIDVGHYSAPTFADIDGDGDLDLVIGEHGGNLNYYKNTGSNTNPTYTKQTGGNNPFNGFDVEPSSTPTFADIDGDGDLDLVIGDAGGNFSYYENTLPVVETIAPTLSASTPPVVSTTNGGDNVGDTITLTVTFSENISGLIDVFFVSTFKVGGVDVEAVWSGKDGTNVRTLTYTVKAGDSGQATIDEAALKAGLVAKAKDIEGNAFEHSGDIADIDTGAKALPVVKGTVTLSASTPPVVETTNGGDNVGDTITLTITFGGDANGLFGGNDSTIFKVDGTGVDAVWYGIPDTNTRTLTYTVKAGQNGQVTIDEAALKTALVAGIKDVKGNAFEHSGDIADIDAGEKALPVVDTTAPVLSADTPPVTALTGGGDSVGDTIVLTITFSENVNGLTDGNDSTIFKVGDAGVEAVWSGTDGTATRILTYTIQAGDSGQALIDESALKTALVAGIKDVKGNAFEHSGDIADIDAGEKALPVVDTTVTDTTAPVLSADTPPVTALTGGGDSVGDTIVLTITFSENVNGLTDGNDSTIFKVGDAGVEAVWSGTDGTNTRILTYTIQAGDSGQALIDESALKTALVAGITDGAGNAFEHSGDIADIDAGEKALPVVDTTVTDTTAPVLSADTPPVAETTNGGDSVGDTIFLTVTFSENVNGLTGGNDSTIFKLDGTGVEAVWLGTDGTNTRILAYTIQAGDSGQASIDESALKTALLAGNIADGAGNALVISGDIADIDATPLPVVDTTAPVLSASTPPVADKTNDGDSVGDTIFLTITFSENVNGLTNGSNNTIFTVDGAGVEAAWSGTDDTNARILTYTIKAGDSGQVAIDESALKTALLAGNIADGAGNALVISGDIADIDATPLPVVDTTAPVLSASTPPVADKTNDGDSVGDTIFLTVTFSEAVNGLTNGSDSTIFKVDGTGVEAVWSGTDDTNTRILTYTIQAGQNGQASIDEAALKTALLDAGITNSAGNALVISGDIADIDATPLPVVDTTAPVLSASTPPVADKTNDGDSVGDTIFLTITFSENVNGLTNGSNNTIFTVDGAGVEAAWSGTDGTNTRILTYTIQAGQNGQASIDEAALKTALLDAGITNSAGNALVISGDIADIDAGEEALPTIDGTPPTVTLSTPNKALALNGTATITIDFSETVSDFAEDDITAVGGTLSSFTKVTDTQYTVIFTLTDATNGGLVRVDSNKFSDAAGNFNVDGSEPDNSITFGTGPSVASAETTLTGGGDSEGDTITLTVTFSAAVDGLTSGSDSTIFKVDGTGVEAVWSGTDDTNTRILTYTVQAGQNGQALIDEAALKTALLAASITDGSDNALLIPDTIADIDAGEDALPVVDTTPPMLSASTPPTFVVNKDGERAILGDTIALTITFSKNVNGLTGGSDDTIFTVAGAGVEAVWSGADDTNTRILTYTVKLDQTGEALIDEAALKTALLAGNITDSAGNALSIPDGIADIDPFAKKLPEIDSPFVLSAFSSTSSLSDSELGETVTFTINFAVAMDETVTPNIFAHDIMKSVLDFQKDVWSNGSKTYAVSYLVARDENNEMLGRISTEIGDVRTLDGQDMEEKEYLFDVRFDMKNPTITSVSFVSTPADGVAYKAGEKIIIHVSFDEAVITMDGIKLTFNMGDETRVALSDASIVKDGLGLAFIYVVQAGDNAVEGLSIDANAVDPETGVALTDNLTNIAVLTHDAVAASTTQKVDTPPIISASTPPVAETTNGGDSVGDTIVLTITFSEAVNGLTGGNDSTIFTVGGTNVEAVWSGTDGETTRILTYTIKAGDSGQATIDEAALKTALVAGITDGVGNAFEHSGDIADIDAGEDALPVVDTTVADTTAPVLSADTPPVADKTNDGDSVGDTIFLTITFSEAVNGLTGGNDSTIFTVGGTNVEAVWSGTDGETTRILTYTIKAGDSGQATIDEAALKTALVAGITDGAGNAFEHSGDIADIDATPLPVVDTAVADTTAPVLSADTPPVADKTNDGDSVGDTIFLTITFSENVNGLTSGNDSTIFKLDGTGVEAVWSGTDGETTRTLTYTIKAGDSGQATIDEAALKTALVAGITDGAGNAFEHSGDIADIDATALPVVDTTVADTTAPVLSADTPPVADKTNDGDSVGDTIFLTITFSENVNGLTSGNDSTIFKVDGTGVEAVWSGTDGEATRILTYTIKAGDSGQATIDEAALKTALVAAGITDGAGNAFEHSGDIADIDATPLPVVDTTVADTTAPVLSASTPPLVGMTGAGDGVGDTIFLTITFSENVNGLTSGNDSTIFKVDGTGVEAVWSGTNGETTRILTYTVKAGDNGQATIDEAALKTALLAAGITDGAGNALSIPGDIEDTNPTYVEQTGDDNPFNDIDVGDASAPTFADIDGDGDLDLVVGEFDGNLNYYKNTGSNTNPTYAKQTGDDNPFSGIDVGFNSTPTFADIDGDGDLDLVIGESDGNINYYKNTGDSTNPTYAEQTGDDNPFNGIDVGSSSAPTFADIDGDGDFDLVIGEFGGNLNYYENTGDSTNPTYEKQTGDDNPFNGIDVGEDSVPTFADIDGDGDLDLVIGEYKGYLNYYENTGDSTNPTYEKQTGGNNPFNDIQATWDDSGGIQPAFADIDGDGDLDLVTGEENGNLFYYENTLPVVDTTAPVLSASTPPVTGMTNGGDGVGDTIFLTITFSEAVNGLTSGNDSTIFKVDGTGVEAVWSGTDGETTRILTYTIKAGDNGQALIDESALKTALLAAGITDGAGNAFEHSGDIADIDTGANALPVVDGTAPVLSASTSPLVGTKNGGDGVGDTIFFAITFSEAVNGLTSGNDSTIFTVGGTNVTAVWSGTDGETMRTLTYTIKAGDNGQALIDEAALKTALVAGITDGAGNALVISGDIADIDATPLPVVDTPPVLSASTPPVTGMTNGGDSVGDTIFLTVTFSKAVNGLTSGNDSTIFTVGGTNVTAVWSGTDGEATRILTYVVRAGDNGQVAISKAALKTALLAAGITDGAGNALSIPGDIEDTNPTYVEQTGDDNPFNDIDVGDASAPTFADIDGDGDLDLVVGEFDGNLNYYKNTGSNTNPTYAKQTGDDNPFSGIDVGFNSTPTFADIDGDGDLDLVIGEGDGNINYYKNTGDSTNPTYAEQTGDDNPFNGIDVGSSSAPTFADIDGDGDFDLVIGEFGGNLNYYENTGDNTDPTYEKQTGDDNPFNGIDVDESSFPTFADIDGDGDLDLVIGEYKGYLNYYENTGDSTNPTYEKQTGGNNPFNDIQATWDNGGGIQPAFADIDGDGDLDLVTGEENGNLFYYENTLPVVDGTAPVLSASTPPVTGMTGGGDSVGDTIFLAVTFSEAVNGLTSGNDSTIFTVGGAGVEAVWSGTDGETTRILTYTVQAGQNGQALIDEAALKTALVAGITDGAGNAFEHSGAIADIDEIYYGQKTGDDNPFNDIDVGFGFFPTLADIDGDDDLDLVIGKGDGNINYYKNTGDSTNPTYAAQTGDDNPFNGIDVGDASAPTFADIDGDGDLDLVIGESDGNINYYKNTGDSTNPTYAEQTGDDNPFNGIDVGGYSAPTFADIDGDGDLDLVSAGDTGRFSYYKNTGDSTNPTYEKQTGSDNPFDGIDVGEFAPPTFADIDGDGDLDLVIGGEDGGFSYYKNTGDSTDPTYAEQTGGNNPFDDINLGYTNVAISFADIDGDGDLDSMMNADGEGIYYYENGLPVVDTSSSAETPALSVIASDDADMFEGTDDVQDAFIWLSTPSRTHQDIVHNFNGTDGDKLDISDLLKGYEAGADINEWVTLEQNDDDTRLTIDVDGQGDGAVEQVILLANVSDYATAADMIADGALVVV